MPVEFDITLTSKDMYRFNLYQTYSGFHGWFSIVVSVIIFAVAGLTFGELETTYTVLYIVFGIIFLIYPPFSLYLNSKRSLKASEVLTKPLHYEVGETGFTVSQNGESAVLLWEQIYKMVATKKLVLVYSNRTNAYVIPREQLGGQYMALSEISNKKLPKYRVKMEV